MSPPGKAGGPQCPYPGLRAFREGDAVLFFGRDKVVDDLLGRFATSRLLALVGPPGCGKTSLIEAGLITDLKSGLAPGLGPDWAVVRVRPGARVLEGLAEQLVDAYPSLRGSDDRAEAAAIVWVALKSAAGGAGLSEVLAGVNDDERGRLLVVVDPLEEVLRLPPGGDPSEVMGLVGVLLNAVGPGGPRWVHAVLALRPETLGECHRFPGLAEGINNGIYLIPELFGPDLLSAIERPAKARGGEVTAELADRLMRDVGSLTDRLPLLQHALMIMWYRAAGEVAGAATPEGPSPTVTLGLAQYEALGGLEGCLSLCAEEGFGGLDEEQRRIAEAMFRLLCERRVVQVDARRRVQVKEIAETARVPADKVRPVADAFRRRERGLIAPRAEVPLTETLYLEVNNECLARHWGRLRQWKDRDRAHDVFLCHNSRDKPAVREIARRLRARGIVAWLDEWELRPGIPWQQIIGDVLRSIGSAAVLVGPNGIGPWQEQEAFGILQDFLQRDCPVIPVILEGCPAAPDMPYFLRPRTWVDFRGRADAALKDLIWGITGRSVEEQERDQLLSLEGEPKPGEGR